MAENQNEKNTKKCLIYKNKWGIIKKSTRKKDIPNKKRK